MTRTDGDSWDLASSVGATATMVAGQRAFAHREQLINDPYAEPLVRAVGLDFFTKALDGDIDLSAVNPAFTPRRAAEGMTVRTRWFDQLFLDAAAAGVRQRQHGMAADIARAARDQNRFGHAYSAALYMALMSERYSANSSLSSSRARPKATVLPDPVCAETSRSRPAAPGFRRAGAPRARR